MRTLRGVGLLLGGFALAALVTPTTSHAAPRTPGSAVTAKSPPAPRLPDADLLMERCVKAWYYQGTDAIAKLRMEIVDRGGEKRYRVMTMLRKNVGDRGEQRYLLYFHEPGDVRRMTCMVWKHVGAIDERWMFVPAANHVRRVAAPERSRFLGSDFTREEFSGRDASADLHRVDRYESYEGRPCWVVESVPKKPVEHTRMTTWVDTTTFIPWKQEFRDRRGGVFRTYTTDKVEEFANAAGRKYLTITERTLWARDKLSHTKLYFESVRYDVGLGDADFVSAHLQVPLEEWYRGAKP